MVTLPGMVGTQHASWISILELHRRIPKHWTLVGGQLVYMHSVERASRMTRPTDDADTVLDVRARGDIHLRLTEALKDMGFAVAGTSPSGVQHRWSRNDGASVDVLIPRWLGERSAPRKGAGSGPALETPGAQKVLNHSETVDIEIGEERGQVNRPNLLGALIGKAAAHTVMLDQNRARHIDDFILLASMVKPSDLAEGLDKKEHRYLAGMLGAITAKGVQPRESQARNGIKLIHTVVSRGPRSA